MEGMTGDMDDVRRLSGSFSDFALYETFYETGAMLGGALVALEDATERDDPKAFRRWRRERVRLQHVRNAVDPMDRGRLEELTVEWVERRRVLEHRLDRHSPAPIPATDARERWESRIRPVVFDGAIPDDPPVTVFLGGQPAAGKTGGQRLAKRMHRHAVPVIGDDYRQYHPDYLRLLTTDPLRMPDVTARLAGEWTGMCVDHADGRGLSIVIEGTWRNPDTVLGEAMRCRMLGRVTHAILMATPPAVSRAGMLDRYCSALLTAGWARWTPPDAHDRTVRQLAGNVPVIARSGLMDRLTVTDRSGMILYDGMDPQGVVDAWNAGFHRPLTDGEIEYARRTALLAKQCARLMPKKDYAAVSHEADLMLAHADNLAKARGLYDEWVERDRRISRMIMESFEERSRR